MSQSRDLYNVLRLPGNVSLFYTLESHSPIWLDTSRCEIECETLPLRHAL